MSKELDGMKDRLSAVFNKMMDIAEADLDVSSINNRNLAANLINTAATVAQTVSLLEKGQKAEAGADEFHDTALALAEAIEQITTRLDKIEKTQTPAETKEEGQQQGPLLPPPSRPLPDVGHAL